MIPILYKETQEDYSGNGIGFLRDTIVADVTEVANGEFSLYLEYPIEGQYAKEIDKFRFIKQKPNTVDEPHIFRVYNLEKDTLSGVIRVYASSKSNDMGKNFVRNLSISGTPQTVFNSMKAQAEIPVPYTFHSDITSSNTISWKNRNLLNCIVGEEGSLIDVFGGELKRGNDDIWLYRRRGDDNVTTLRDGKNVRGIESQNSIEGLITRIVPFYTYKEEESDQERIIWGNVVDSPLINNYPEIYAQPVDFSSEVETLNELNSVAATYFETKEIDKPSLTLTIDLIEIFDSVEYEKFKDLERVNLFDTLTVYSKKYNVNVSAKVNTIVYDSLKEVNKEVSIGTYVTGLWNEMSKDYNDRLREIENKIVTYVQTSANGLNKTYRGTEDPNTAGITGKENDSYYRDMGENRTQLWQYENSQWNLILDTSRIDEAEQAIAQQKADLEEVKTTADYSYEQLQQTIANSGFTDLDTAFANVKTLSEQAESNAQAALSSASNAVGLAEGALSSASNAVGLAEDASSLAATLSGQVSDFELTVNGFDQTVNNYEDQVAQFTSDVNGLNSTVASYETQVDEFGNTVGTYATQVSQFENTVSGLNSTVSSYRSDVQGYEAQVSTLTNTVDGFNATVQRVEADYSGLSGTVQSLGASIGVVEGQITNRVWQADIQGAIDGIEIGGRNLLTNLPANWVVASVSGMTGEDYPSSTALRSPYIKVEPGEYIYTLSNSESDDTRTYVYGYDEDKNGIKTIHSWDSVYPIKININDSNIKFLRFIIRSHVDDVAQIASVNDMGDSIKAQLKKGNVATDWTPAPEDTTELISSVQSEFTQRADSIEATISSIETDLDKKATIEKVNSIESTVDGTVQRITSIETDIDTKASVAQLNEIKSTVDGTVQTIATIQTDLDGKATVTAVNSIKDTVDGTVQSISDIEGNITTIESTVRGHTTTITNAEGRITTTEQTINGLQNTVSDPVNGLTTQVSQLSEGFRVLSGDFENLEVGGRNLLRNGDFSNNEYAWSGIDGGIKQDGGLNYITIVGTFDVNQSIHTDKGQAYTVSALVRKSTDTDSIFTVKFNSDNADTPYVAVTNSEWKRISTTRTATTTGPSVMYFHTRTDFPIDIAELKIEKGNVATDWIPAPEDMAYQAQLAVTNENVLARVQKGDVYSQLLIDSRNILFDANDRIMLSADKVVIDASEGAFITSAIIESLSADKITAGTIDASQVNVINLDADEISAGTIHGALSDWNLNTGIWTSYADLGNPGDSAYPEGSIYVRIGDGRLDSVSAAEYKTFSLRAGALVGTSEYPGYARRTVSFSGEGMIGSSTGNQYSYMRSLDFTDEGMEMRSISGTGTQANTSLKLTSIVNASHNYIHFEDPQYNHRIRQISSNFYIEHDNSGELRITNRSRDTDSGVVFAFVYATRNSSGDTIQMIEDRIQTPRNGIRDLFLSPNGTGKVRVANKNRDYYPIRASDFENASSRNLKTNINPLEIKALDIINNLMPVTYNLKSDLKNGVDELKAGLIAEDSLSVASSDGESINTYTWITYLNKAVQELSTAHENVVLLANKAYLKAESNEERIERLEAELKLLKGERE